MATVLILAHEHRPYNRPSSNIGAQRTYSFEKYLPEAGWKVIVLCCDASQRRKIASNEISTVITEFEKQYNATPKDKSKAYPLPSLKYNGFFDFLWMKTIRVKADGSFESKKSFFLSLLRPFLTLAKQLTKGDYSSSWVPVAEAVADKIIANEKIDFIIAEHSPDASVFIAKSLHDKYNIPWGVDYRDFVIIPFKGITKGIVKRHHQRLIRSSSLIVNVTNGWSELFYKTFNRKSYTLTNGYLSEEFSLMDKGNSKDEIFRVSYTGSIRPEIQEFEVFMKGYRLFCDTLSSKDEWKVKFQYCGGNSEYVQAIVDKYKLNPFCIIHQRLQRDEAIRMMITSDLLLLLGIKRNVPMYSGMYLPGKLFEYMYSGVKILSIPSDKGDLDNVLLNNNVGVAIDTSEQVCALLQKEYAGKFASRSQSNSKTSVEAFDRRNIAFELAKEMSRFI